MQFEIDLPETLGMRIRASRKALDMRQDDAAGNIGVNENFLGKIERGGETAAGKAFPGDQNAAVVKNPGPGRLQPR